MQCPRCGRPLGGGAAFCPNCGTMLAAHASPGGVAMPIAARRNNNAIWAILGTLAVVAAIIFGLKAAGILQFGSRPAGHGLEAQGAPPDDGLGMRGVAPPASLPQGHSTTGMPDDVRRYLEHVQRIEKRKVDLSLQMISELEIFKNKLGTFGGAEGLMNHDEDLGGDGKRPDTETRNTFTDFRSRWDDIVSDFKTMDPPPQCVSLRDDYYRALSEIPGMAGDLFDVLNMVETDPQGALQKAQGMQSKSGNAIDKYFGQSDDDVGQICSHYNTSKWFDIKKDVGGGGLSMGGLGGGL